MIRKHAGLISYRSHMTEQGWPLKPTWLPTQGTKNKTKKTKKKRKEKKRNHWNCLKPPTNLCIRTAMVVVARVGCHRRQGRKPVLIQSSRRGVGVVDRRLAVRERTSSGGIEECPFGSRHLALVHQMLGLVSVPGRERKSTITFCWYQWNRADVFFSSTSPTRVMWLWGG